VPGYQLAVRGKHWGASAPLTFTLTSAAGVQRIRLRTTRKGQFLVGINGLDRCLQVAVLVAEGANYRLGLAHPAPLCPVHAQSGIGQPVLTVIKGKQM
jgi:hypothetical protein